MSGGDAPRPLTAAEAVHHAREAVAGGEPAAGVTVVECSSADEGPSPGDRMVVWAARHAGTLGSAELDAAAISAARELLPGTGHSAPGTVRPETRTLEAGGRACTVYLEPHLPPPELVIVGAGHIARPLCRMGALLGFRVTVLDDRPEFATRERFPEAAEVRRADFSRPFEGVRIDARTHLVLVTRGHRYDYDALVHALRAPEPPAYVGMVGSRRRTRAALEQLAREGFPPERLATVFSPVGLDVGAETPEEIAVSIAAEIVRVRRGGTGQSLRDRERVVERWIAPRG